MTASARGGGRQLRRSPWLLGEGRVGRFTRDGSAESHLPRDAADRGVTWGNTYTINIKNASTRPRAASLHRWCDHECEPSLILENTDCSLAVERVDEREDVEVDVPRGQREAPWKGRERKMEMGAGGAIGMSGPTDDGLGDWCELCVILEIADASPGGSQLESQNGTAWGAQLQPQQALWGVSGMGELAASVSTASSNAGTTPAAFNARSLDDESLHVARVLPRRTFTRYQSDQTPNPSGRGLLPELDRMTTTNTFDPPSPLPDAARKPIFKATYGQILIIRKGFQSAMFYSLVAYEDCQAEPLHQVDNRHHFIAQALAFLMRYVQFRQNLPPTRSVLPFIIMNVSSRLQPTIQRYTY
ncbi:hypothetical protein DFH09DRAFT_1360606 [Mycena vulgaris]|nr:hypothetical protein DFH09DRAFT_1360606 [Mycena vulgaris]